MYTCQQIDDIIKYIETKQLPLSLPIKRESRSAIMCFHQKYNDPDYNIRLDPNNERKQLFWNDRQIVAKEKMQAFLEEKYNDPRYLSGTLKDRLDSIGTAIETKVKKILKQTIEFFMILFIYLIMKEYNWALFPEIRRNRFKKYKQNWTKEILL